MLRFSHKHLYPVRLSGLMGSVKQAKPRRVGCHDLCPAILVLDLQKEDESALKILKEAGLVVSELVSGEKARMTSLVEPVKNKYADEINASFYQSLKDEVAKAASSQSQKNP